MIESIEYIMRSSLPFFKQYGSGVMLLVFTSNILMFFGITRYIKTIVTDSIMRFQKDIDKINDKVQKTELDVIAQSSSLDNKINVIDNKISTMNIKFDNFSKNFDDLSRKVTQNTENIIRIESDLKHNNSNKKRRDNGK